MIYFSLLHIEIKETVAELLGVRRVCCPPSSKIIKGGGGGHPCSSSSYAYVNVSI